MSTIHQAIKRLRTFVVALRTSQSERERQQLEAYLAEAQSPAEFEYRERQYAKQKAARVCAGL